MSQQGQIVKRRKSRLIKTKTDFKLNESKNGVRRIKR